MYPVIQIGPATMQSSVLAFILALWLGTFAAERECKPRGIKGDDAWNFVFVAAAATIFFARLIYVLQNWDVYASNWLDIFSPTPGTLALGYGAAFAIVPAYAYIQRRKIPLARFADALAPGALLAMALIALGQFLSGDAFGEPTDLPWGIWMWGETRHPAQLYDASSALIGFALARRAARAPARDGSAALFAAAWYSAARVFVDAFRGEPGILPGGYRDTQVVALIALLSALWTLMRLNAPKERYDA
jgi:phosphatidylglycerol:prolipoprotein diacylglycerol transferase